MFPWRSLCWRNKSTFIRMNHRSYKRVTFCTKSSNCITHHYWHSEVCDWNIFAEIIWWHQWWASFCDKFTFLCIRYITSADWRIETLLKIEYIVSLIHERESAWLTCTSLKDNCLQHLLNFVLLMLISHWKQHQDFFCVKKLCSGKCFSKTVIISWLWTMTQMNHKN